MSKGARLTAIGLMSGTSMDGIDAALIETDGLCEVTAGPSITLPYDVKLREGLRQALGQREAAASLVVDLTDAHIDAVVRLLQQAGRKPDSIDVIGFHGHTILHEPWRGETIQIGSGDQLARATGIDVVANLRAADVAGGGQGAPLVPLYHAALTRTAARPVALLNIGGVANVTWIGEHFDLDEPAATAEHILAFDTGPGNALLDDWVFRHTGAHWDQDGALARKGRVHEDLVAAFLEDDYFARPPPKSLDRNDFRLDEVADLSPEDGAATLVSFTAAAVARAVAHMPIRPAAWYACGGGRHNPVMMEAIQAGLGVPLAPVEAIGLDGDALEAQAFAWLAVRSVQGRALTLPTTTGVGAATSGGELYLAD